MKKMLAQVLIALLLIPSLACAMPVCPENAEITEKPHCADKTKDIEIEKSDNVMLFADCMGLDLQHSPLPLQMTEPTFSPDPNELAGLSFGFKLGTDPLQIDVIRGPPVLLDTARSQSPIYLVTQRLRL